MFPLPSIENVAAFITGQRKLVDKYLLLTHNMDVTNAIAILLTTTKVIFRVLFNYKD